MAIVYKTTNLINGKMYIGVDSINNPKYLGSGELLKKAIIKYGKENFDKNILVEFDDPADAFIYEKYIIEKMDAVNSDDYYNIKPGGLGGHNGYDYSGENNPMYGRSMLNIFSNKYGITGGAEFFNNMHKKIGESNRGKIQPFSDEHKKAISEAKKEYYRNIDPVKKLEINLKIGKTLKDSNITRNDEYKENMSQIIRKKSADIHRKEECLVCGAFVSRANLSRWHGKNCKYRGDGKEKESK